MDLLDHLQTVLGFLGDSHSKCRGTTQRGATCGSKISKANKQKAESLLKEVTGSICQEQIARFLGRVAPLLLCQRNHQSQSKTVVTKWTKQVEEAHIVVKLEPNDESDNAREICQEKSIKTENSQKDVIIKRESSISSDTKSRAKSETLPEPLFRHYSDPKSTTALNAHIKSILSTPLSSTLIKSANGPRTGCVYAYTFHSSPCRPIQRLKIGYTIDLPRRLMDVEKNCHEKPKVLCKFETRLHQKVERIVHAQLANQRLKMRHPCSGCGSCHQEWFDIRLSAAAAVMGLWTDWSLQDPYDEAGRLKEVWQNKLNKLDLSDPCCWVDFVCGDCPKQVRSN